MAYCESLIPSYCLVELGFESLVLVVLQMAAVLQTAVVVEEQVHVGVQVKMYLRMYLPG